MIGDRASAYALDDGESLSTLEQARSTYTAAR